jgi:hypothetical protein
MKIMVEDDIPTFVEAVIATGCDITAIGDHLYTIGDADLPEPERFKMQLELEDIGVRFGERDHLKAEIITYLHSIGRSYNLVTIH